jgi:hypothetical protein
MAQDFRNTLAREIGTGDTTILAGGNYDAVIGIRCCNIVATTILVDVKIAKGGVDYFLAKGVNIPPNSAIELIQGGAKLMESNMLEGNIALVNLYLIKRQRLMELKL